MPSTRYLEIANRLAIELADCPPGARVASEPELADRFGVGRAAARSALQELERRLLVRRVQGAGTFVNRRIDYVISHSRPPSWHATVAAAGATPRSQVKSVQRTVLPAGRAEQLDCPAGTAAYRIVRNFFIDDLLASWTEEWIPVDVSPDLDLAVHAVESIDLVLRQMGRVCPVRAWCRVSFDIPPEDVLRGLRMEASVPVWQVDSVSRDGETGRGLMASTAWTRADAVRVVVELQDTVPAAMG
ncbi:MAG: GntR family transcriptional regulator, phosphonate transport system regulatory protein [Pseudonocardiales bacterium]|nr:GntR family transcriptional regulator, phosphonate transport system regulatory protein [Pseudonocardiales bacterium]